MKFARYLQDTQTPEWKRAYIDYRGLKKRITAIRKIQQGLELTDADSPLESTDDLPLDAARASDDHPRTERDLPYGSRERGASRISLPRERSQTLRLSEDENNPSNFVPPTSTVANGRTRSSTRGRRPSFAQGISIPSFRRGRGKSVSSRLNGSQSRPSNPLTSLPLHELLAELSPSELTFFTLLDSELDKVETFYVSREKEMLTRGKMLQEQLAELSDHRKLVLESHPKAPWSSALASTIRSKLKVEIKANAEATVQESKGESTGHDSGVDQQSGKLTTISRVPSLINMRIFSSNSNKDKDKDEDSSSTDGVKENVGKRGVPLSSDPDYYVYAKKKLKKAVLEHYRGAEVLHNYRILNITGFRKALKKFEKVTKV
ncbi:SPX domain-containing protein [Crucibulum laeve]|uniref:SPX domain-containing protein n=1 Tax=Crucibulum laeve TaxID=68775 RepID=A0A5C3LZY5_9AGAR|nr:SPX domain-containing protein [Crucibulum laeve]